MSYNSLLGLGASSPDAALEGFWPLQETTGTSAVDYSGNSQNGTITGMGANPVTVTGPTNWLTSAFDFDGSGDYVSVGTVVADGIESSNAFTLLAWVNADNATADGGIIGAADSPNFQFALWHDIDGTGDGAALAVWNNLAGAGGAIIGTDNADGLVTTWKHVAASHESGSQVVYVSGSSTATGASTHTIGAGSVGVFLGSQSTTAKLLDGKLAECIIFSRVLTSGEIAEIIAGPEPENTVAPTVSGNTAQGSTLTCSPGTWALPSPFASGSNGTITYTYQWTRDGGDISGATSSTYVTQAADIGTAVGCKVLGVNDGGSSSAEQTASSNTISVVASGTTYRMNMRLFIPTQV